jgi:hypothetical protein
MPSRIRPAPMYWFQGDYAEHTAGRPRLMGIQSLKMHIPLNRQGGFHSWVFPEPQSVEPDWLLLLRFRDYTDGKVSGWEAPA